MALTLGSSCLRQDGLTDFPSLFTQQILWVTVNEEKKIRKILYSESPPSTLYPHFCHVIINPLTFVVRFPNARVFR